MRKRLREGMNIPDQVGTRGQNNISLEAELRQVLSYGLFPSKPYDIDTTNFVLRLRHRRLSDLLKNIESQSGRGRIRTQLCSQAVSGFLTIRQHCHPENQGKFG